MPTPLQSARESVGRKRVNLPRALALPRHEMSLREQKDDSMLKIRKWRFVAKILRYVNPLEFGHLIRGAKQQCEAYQVSMLSVWGSNRQKRSLGEDLSCNLLPARMHCR